MPPVSTYLRRAPRTLMFWLVVAILVVGAVRSFFPNNGFDEVRTGEVPLELAGSDDGVWVLNFGDHSVSLVRTSDQEILLTTEVGEDVAPALTANDDGAWVLLDEGRTVARVDPDSGDVADRIDLTDTIEGPAQDLSAGDGFLWVTSGVGGQMVRVEGDGTVGEAIDLGEPVVQPQVLDDVVWVNETSGLGEYDAESGERLRLVETEHSVHDFVADDRALWLLADVDNVDQSGLVVRLDPDEGTEDGRLRIADARPSHLAVAGEQLFISGSGGLLFELATEPLTLLASEQVAVSTKDLRGIIVHDDVVWIADGTNGIVHQPIDGIEGDIPTDTTVPA
jgi:hypothetical protein